MTPRRSRNVGAMAAIASLAFALSGCTPAVDQTESASPAPEPTPSATAMPHAVFDGDCGALLTDDAMSEAVGQRMNILSAMWEDGTDRGLGGISCGWTSEDYLAATASARAYPVDVLDPEYVASEAVNGCDAEAHLCVVSEAVDGVWVSVSVRSDHAADMTEGISLALADIHARLSDQPRPVPEARDGWWAPAPTCDELQSELNANGMQSTVAEYYPDGSKVFVDGPLRRSCTLVATVDGTPYSTVVHLRSGAGEAMESARSSSDEAGVEYNGHEFAAVIEQYPMDGAAGVLLGSVGPNLVELDRVGSSEDVQRDASVLDAVIAALA